MSESRVCGTDEERITMAHGSGGKAMRHLVENEIVAIFSNPQLDQLEDQARIALTEINPLGDRLAFTTDSFVVDPLEFPGGDIGNLAINGTVNDLAMSGASPLYLTCGLIIEEGLPLKTLRKILKSMRKSADLAGVALVSGDTKVVEKGAADKLFINTSGIGVIPHGLNIQASNAKEGDRIIVNGYIGDHGATILQARGDLSLDTDIQSDCQALHQQVAAMLAVSPEIHCMRDATRGGIATTLNEFAQSSNVRITIDEDSLPIRPEVRGMCELLGMDPVFFANEGKFIAIVPEHLADDYVTALKKVPGSEQACIIGRVQNGDYPCVSMRTSFGGERLVDMLQGDQLPRIC